jgi:lysophospholipase L1-like esterase
VKVVCLGDSITAGQHLDEGLGAWPAHLKGVTAYAAAVPGDTTRLALERFPSAVQIAAPDVVVIQFGHNDANRWQTDRGLPRVSIKAYAANLHEMIDRADAFGIVPILCTLTPSLRSPAHARDCRAYDRALRKVAEERYVELVDVSWFGAEHLLDGLHLNIDGHLAYAKAVQEALP